MRDVLKIFSGNSSKKLANDICDQLGIDLGAAEVSAFSDGEVSVEIQESVRGGDVFLIQSTNAPVNNNLMELLIMIDAAKRASADRITVVIPYYGYARQDRKVAPRAPITAKLVADLLNVAGAQRIVTVDLHANQIQGFFNIPVDNLYAIPVLKEIIMKYVTGDAVVVSPDAGGAKRARYMAKRLYEDTGLAIIDKRRTAPNQVDPEMNIVGDVKGKVAILLDDIVDTAGSIERAAEALDKNGAREVYAACTHPVLSGPAIERIEKSVVKHMFVTDTIPLSNDCAKCEKIKVVSLAPLLATTIENIHKGESVSRLFDGIDI